MAIPRSIRRSSQRGYALLSVIALGAIMIVTAAAVMPNLITAGTREKEAELLWRGNQYARAVKLFYRKNGRFPASIDDLVKKQGNIRFLRREYKDPFNREDGKWRLIYVLPNGQLVGSLTRTNILLQIPGQGPQRPGGLPGQPAPGVTPQAGTATSGQPGATSATGQSTTGGLSGGGQVIGGSVIGVASKVPQQSIRVFNGGLTYREWEFMWDPARDAQPVGGVPGGQPAGQPGGVNPGGRPGGGTLPRRP